MEWRDARGRTRRVWVFLDEAEALRERIEGLRSGATGVRVELGEGTVEEHEEDEAEATGAARSGRRSKGAEGGWSARHGGETASQRTSAVAGTSGPAAAHASP